MKGPVSARDDEDDVTEQLNEVYEDESSVDPFLLDAARRTFDRSEW